MNESQLSERALLRRINRKLVADGQKVLRQRGTYGSRGDGPHYRDPNLGRFFVIDTRHTFLVESDIDLEDLGKELGALSRQAEV